jgi:hypothetical protein
MDEPTDGSVVLDSGGYAWQRVGNLWTGYQRERLWVELIRDFPPLTVVYSAPVDEGDS